MATPAPAVPGTGFSPNERSHLRRCRLIVWATPIVAGFIYGAAFAAIHFLVPPTTAILSASARSWLLPLFFATALVTGCIAAYAVARLHPVQRRKWLRAGVAFLFAIALAWTAASVFGILFLYALAIIYGEPFLASGGLSPP